MRYTTAVIGGFELLQALFGLFFCPYLRQVELHNFAAVCGNRSPEGPNTGIRPTRQPSVQRSVLPAGAFFW